MSELDVRSFTVGPVQENTYVVRLPGATSALLIDPGDEPERLLRAIADLGVQIEAILITHCHFDHIGAVAPLARATGAPVYCPVLERPVLEDIRLGTPPGFGPFESHVPERTLAGGESLSLADLEIEVLLTPGHSPGHLTFSLPAHAAIVSGDVLFQGSIGRTDLPFADHPTLERTLATLIETLPPETTVYPGHMGVTTLGRELATNPFLLALRPGRPSPVSQAAPAHGAGGN
ncbi:MAG TPA: MBL fold metallo-hydrolase [Solirubrobacteraceae bacterium]|jgi:hydroxyacylglutathione hydrolase|nr:MBL fold metallo-hydrolase [Solirubrobacteraceae bacterium]